MIYRHPVYSRICWTIKKESCKNNKMYKFGISHRENCPENPLAQFSFLQQNNLLKTNPRIDLFCENSHYLNLPFIFSTLSESKIYISPDIFSYSINFSALSIFGMCEKHLFSLYQFAFISVHLLNANWIYLSLFPCLARTLVRIRIPLQPAVPRSV